MTRRFEYISAEDDQEWRRAFADTLGLRFHLAAELRRNRGAYDLARTAKYLTALTRGRLLHKRAMLDDPFAVLSTQWLVQRPNTANGYTNGINWRSAAQLFDATIDFAARVGARWSVSEFGYLEDSTRPGHRATAISEAIDYAIAHNAVAVQYWDSIGRRGDWRLRHSTSTTNAFAEADER